MEPNITCINLIKECMINWKVDVVQVWNNLYKNKRLSIAILREYLPSEYMIAVQGVELEYPNILYEYIDKTSVWNITTMSESPLLTTDIIDISPHLDWNWKSIVRNCPMIPVEYYSKISSHALDLSYLAKHTSAPWCDKFCHILEPQVVVQNKLITWNDLQTQPSYLWPYFAGNYNMTAELYLNRKDIFHNPIGLKALINNRRFSVTDLNKCTGISVAELINNIDDPVFDNSDQLMEAIRLNIISGAKASYNDNLTDDIIKSFPHLDWDVEQLLLNEEISTEQCIQIINSTGRYDLAQYVALHGTVELMEYNSMMND
jgi:hypothetical protein